MLININTPVSLSIEDLTDLPKLKAFMEHNNIKLNKSELARQLGINRRTVDKYLEGYEKPSHRNKPSKIDIYHDEIEALLNSSTQVFHFRSVLYRYMVDNYGMNVPEQTFYHYLKSVPEFDNYFKKNKSSASSSNPVIRYETEPGEQGQFDWKESIPFILRDTGERITVNILVLLMGNSRLRIYRPSLWMTQDILIHLLVECFESLGGVPRVLLTDNMRTVMDEARTQSRKGKVNARFAAFAKDFGFKLVPCIAASPKTKGKVESQMKYLDEIKAYSGKLTLVELFELVERINNRVNNTICQGTGRIPIIEFEKERPFLLPLPNESIRNQYKVRIRNVKVNTAGMVTINSNQYSVPTKFIGKEVQYQLHDSKVYIYADASLIAVHKLTDRKLNYTAEHYAEVLSYKYIGKDSDEVRQLAKQKLANIGGTYT